ncbi:MAG: glycosyltransferase family 4 protein [Candidatus Magasanikbacteria bacterium]|nr:glycosyltransferase family 4 protein [Candidatus Magasanikbacteria bacterium]
MRIALLTNAFPPVMRGGGGRIASWHEQILLDAGHEVRVFCPPITWFDKPILSRLFYHFRDLFSRSTVTSEIVVWNPDILITENLTGCGFGTPQAVIAKTGAQWVHVLHDVQLFEPSGRLKDAERITLWQYVWGGMRRFVFGDPQTVICPTQWLYEEHRRRGFFTRSEVAILPNPAPEEQFVLRSPRMPLSLLLIGATQEKGLAMAEWLASHAIDCAVTVTYPPTQYISIPKESHVLYVPNDGPDSVVQMMKEADVLLVPSTIVENQPTVILEAASVGLPVIASDIGGIRETLDGAGTLCHPWDDQAWLEAVDLHKQPAFYSSQALQMYELARKRVFADYAYNFVTLVEELIQDQNDTE